MRGKLAIRTIYCIVHVPTRPFGCVPEVILRPVLQDSLVVLVLIGINEMCYALVIMLYLCCYFWKKECYILAIVYIGNNSRWCEVWIVVNGMREESD